MTTTGVAAGSYTKVTVDTKGRVTAGVSTIASAEIADLSLTDIDFAPNAGIAVSKISFTNDSISGDRIDGGTISNFASTGMDDNATSLALTISSNGNVGIGTTTPSQKLTVSGVIESTSGGFKFPDGSVQSSANGQWVTSGNNVYRANGFVGIGTSSPDYHLSVTTPTADVSGIIQATDSTKAHFLTIWSGRPTDANPAVVYASGRDLRFGTWSNSLGGGWIENMRLTSNGNLGIGTSSPATRLEVSGSVRASGYQSSDGTPVYGGNIYTRWGNATAPSGTELLYSGFAYSAYYGHSGSGDTTCIKTNGTAGTTAYSYGDLLYAVDVHHLHNDGVPAYTMVKCAVYYSPRPRAVIWGDNTCPANWTLSYHGYAIGSYFQHAAPIERICLDVQNLDASVNVGGSKAHMYATNLWQGFAELGNPPTNRNVRCAVCSKN